MESKYSLFLSKYAYIFLQITPENERNSKIDLLDSRARNLDEKISEYVESNNKRIGLLRDQVDLCSECNILKKLVDPKDPKNAPRRKSP